MNGQINITNNLHCYYVTAVRLLCVRVCIDMICVLRCPNLADIVRWYVL